MKEGVCHDIVDTGLGMHPLFVGTNSLLHQAHEIFVEHLEPCS